MTKTRRRRASARARRRFQHRSLCSGQKLGAGRRQNPQALLERDAAWPFAARDRGVSRRCRYALDAYPEGTASALRAAIGEKFGLDPARIVCGAGSDEMLHLLATAYIGAGDEGIFTAARLSRLQDRHSRRGRNAGRRAGDQHDRRRRRHSRQGHAAHESRILRQSEQSDRHLSAGRRGRAARRQPAARRPARHRRRLCRICDARPITRPARRSSRRAKMS